MIHSNFPRRLHDDERLVFLHIPKTAGTTFSEILSRHFRPQEIFDSINQDFFREGESVPVPRSGDEGYRIAHEMLNDDIIHQYRLFIGHWDYGIVDRFPKLIPITFLRHPLDRLISLYRFMKQNDHVSNPLYDRMQSLSLKKWTAEMGAAFSNFQTRQMTGQVWTQDFPKLSDTELLKLAKKNLEKCVFIGIQECFDDSLFLLSYTFNWGLIEKYESRRVMPQAMTYTELPLDEQEALLKMSELDMELYEFGKGLYNQQLSYMVQDLFEGMSHHTSPVVTEHPSNVYPSPKVSVKKLFYPYLKQQIRQHLTERAKVIAAPPGNSNGTVVDSHNTLAASSFESSEFEQKLAEFEKLYEPNEFARLSKTFRRLLSPAHEFDYQQVMRDYPHYTKLVVDHPALYPVIERYGEELQAFTQGPFPLPNQKVMQGEWLGIYKTKNFLLCDVSAETVQGKSILDIGCNAGFDTFYLATLGASEVIGIDPSAFIYQALFLRSVYYSPTVKFFKLRWQDISPNTFGTFDVVNCQGILYHEPYPYMLLERLFDLLTPGGKVVLETHVTLQDDMKALFVEGQFRGESTWWWIPSVNVTTAMLRACGFIDVQFRASVPADSRNPDNRNYTVEGIPIGGRAFFTAFRPVGSPVRKT